MLMQNPLLADHLEFTPFRIFKTAEKAMRVYTEWLSGDAAWAMQVRSPLNMYALQATAHVQC